MKLKSALRRRPATELVKIAEAWGCDGETPPAEAGRDTLIEHLYPRLQAKVHFQFLWDALSEGRRRLVIFLAIHGGDMGLRELARRSFGGDTRAARRALAPLIESGLVFRDSTTSSLTSDDYYGLPDLLLRHIDLYAHFRGYLGQFLHDLSTEQLERIAVEGLQLKPKALKRDYLRHLVRHSLLKPSILRTHLQRLPTDERELLHEIMRRGGVCIYSDLIDLGFQRHFDHSKVDLLNRLLNQSGLLFIAAKGANKYADLLMVPKDVMHVVRSGFREDRRSLTQLDTATAGGKHAPAAVLDSGTQMLRDMVIFVSHVRQHSVRRLANGGVGKNDLKRILPTLSPGKTIKYARFLALCATELSLIVPVGERWQVGDRFEPWAAHPSRAYADLVQLWARTSSWNEEFHEGDVAHTDTKVQHLLDITEFRRLAVECLMSLPHGHWVEFSAFADVLLPQVALAVPRRAQRALGKFNRPPFFIAESIVVDSLHWLGIVAVGSDSRRHLEAVQNRGNLPVGGPRRKLRQRLKTAEHTHLLFRVTEMGDAALRLLGNGAKGDLPDSPALHFDGTQFTVQPNQEILAPPDLSLIALSRLLRVCEVKSMDVTATLTLTPDSLRHGLELGVTTEEILGLLHSGSSVPLPETVEHLIQEASRNQTSLCISAGGGVLHVDDPVTLAAICANRKIKPQIREVIDDQVILFHPHADLLRVAQEIERLGHSVEVDSGASVPAGVGKISMKLSERDVFLAIAGMRFLASLEEEMGIDLSEGRMRSVIKRMQPSGPRLQTLEEYADTMSKRFTRRHSQALKRHVEQATERHRLQVEKLLEKSPSRPAGRFAFTGPNPSHEPDDVRSMAEFAIEHELPIKVTHHRGGKGPVTETLTPQSIEGDRLYALSSQRGTHLLFRFDRIREAHLL
jgi:XPB/Ssl2-like helicase family protein